MTDTSFEVLREMYSTCVTHPKAYAGNFYEFYKDFVNETTRRGNERVENGTKEK